MSKYNKLTDYLSNLEGDAFMTNFGALEEILGFALPASARQYPAWWANQDKGQSLAWQSAGWKTAGVSVDTDTIQFIRADDCDEITSAALPTKLSIAEAKNGLAANFGVSPDAIEIIIKG